MRKATWFFFVVAISVLGCGDKTSPETAPGDSENALDTAGSAPEKILPDPPLPAPKTDHLPGGFEESRQALENFLQAPNWRDRLEFIEAAERLRDRVETHYANHPDGPIENYRVKLLSLDETPADGDFPLYVFTLHLEEESNEFPVTIRKTPDGMKVDWEIFTEFRNRNFKRFIESGKDGPETLRVILQRQSYWGDDRDAMAGHLSYRIMTMEPNRELFVFVPKDSPLIETMEEFYNWGVGSIAASVVIERQPFPHGESHFLITRLATHPKAGDGWHIRP